jgi:rRNA maturation protein Nop10
MKPPEKKATKFKKCPKCATQTLFAICEKCGAYVGLAKVKKAE